MCLKCPFNTKGPTLGLKDSMWQWKTTTAPLLRNRLKTGAMGNGTNMRFREKRTTAIAGRHCEMYLTPSSERLKKISCWQFYSGSVVSYRVQAGLTQTEFVLTCALIWLKKTTTFICIYFSNLRCQQAAAIWLMRSVQFSSVQCGLALQLHRPVFKLLGWLFQPFKCYITQSLQYLQCVWSYHHNWTHDRDSSCHQDTFLYAGQAQHCATPALNCQSATWETPIKPP